MQLIKSLNKWANRNSDNYVIDILRISLGIFLVIKGIKFMTDTNIILEILGLSGSFISDMLVVHYVTLAHLIGGILIILGLFTRWMVIVQIPIIVGALAINFMGHFSVTNVLQVSVVLFLCLFFIVIGSGKHSVDYSLKMEM